MVGRKKDENDESAKNGYDDNNVKSIKYNRKYQKRINHFTDDDNDDKSVKSDDNDKSVKSNDNDDKCQL